MRRIVFDLEADNFRDECTKIHCLVAKDIDTKAIYRFWGELPDWRYASSLLADDTFIWNLPLNKLSNFFSQTTLVIGHNIIFYDLPVLKRLANVDYMGEVQDTLIYSKTLYPDRPMPKGCPNILFNPITGKNDKVGPHSIHAWGYRVGRSKPEYYDWSKFTPGMLNRCQEDMEINELVYYELLKEAGL